MADQAQEAFWREFWRQASPVQIDEKSLARKLYKQGGYLLERLDLTGKSVLDVGCGFGFIDRYLVGRADCSVTGVDLQAHLIQQPEGDRRRLKYVSGDCLDLPLPAESFDVVLAVEVLHHLRPFEHGRALDEMCRVLKPGGDLVLIEVNRFHPLILALTIFDRSERNQRSLSVRRLATRLRPLFSDIELHPLNYFLPTYKYKPPPLVERLRKLVHFLEDATEARHLCMEYLLVARRYEPRARNEG